MGSGHISPKWPTNINLKAIYSTNWKVLGKKLCLIFHRNTELYWNTAKNPTNRLNIKNLNKNLKIRSAKIHKLISCSKLKNSQRVHYAFIRALLSKTIIDFDHWRQASCVYKYNLVNFSFSNIIEFYSFLILRKWQKLIDCVKNSKSKNESICSLHNL